jgi:hypothetical protein
MHQRCVKRSTSLRNCQLELVVSAIEMRRPYKYFGLGSPVVTQDIE